MANIITVVGNPTMSDEGGVSIAGSLVEAARSWEGGSLPPILRLYKNDPAIVPGMVLADFVECDFTGYAESTMSALTEAQDADGRPMVTTGQVTFTGGSPLTVPGQATGYYWVDGDDTVVIAAERFPNAFPIDQVGDKVQITPRLFFTGREPQVP